MAKDKQRSPGKGPGDTGGKGGRSGEGQQGQGGESFRRGEDRSGSAQQDQGGDTSQQGSKSGRNTREREADNEIEAVSSPRSRADSSDSPDAGKT